MGVTPLPRPPSWIWGPLRGRKGTETGRERKGRERRGGERTGTEGSKRKGGKRWEVREGAGVVVAGGLTPVF